MDIRQIVEDTLVTPARLAAAEARLEQAEPALRALEAAGAHIDRLELEIKSLREQRDTWHECFLSARRQHERFVGELHRRFQNTAARDELLLWDEMADMVRDAYLAIHGPSDGNAG